MAYSDLCAQPQAKHTCTPCPQDLVEEFAGARSAGFITESYLPNVLAAPVTLQVWLDGIASGDIIMLPETRGSYDPGTPKELPGFGDRKFSYGAREMTLNLSETFDRQNLPFWSSIHERTDLVPFFRSSSLVRIFDTVGVTTAGDPVSEDLEDLVLFTAASKVVSKNLPIAVPVTAIRAAFRCPGSGSTTGFRFTTQPSGKIVAISETTSLSGAVVAGGSGSITYQWQKKVGGSFVPVINSGTGQNTTSASGMATSTLAFSSTTAVVEAATPAPADEGTYRLKATDSSSTPVVIYSSEIDLSVLDSKFSFATSATPTTTSDDGGSGATGVSLNAGATDATKTFAFDLSASHSGSPATMPVKVNNVIQLNVNAPSEYFAGGGKPFRFKDAAGVLHYGNFNAAGVNF